MASDYSERRDFTDPRPPHRVPHPVMFQRWNSLTFLHWRYPPESLRPLLPDELLLDTFDGAAWVGLTPFLLSSLRPPFVPAFPWISKFPEMNVRTYVTGPDGKPGIWFFTLEADRLGAVLGARVLYRLPYRWAHMRVIRHAGHIEYESDRNHMFGHGRVRISIRPRAPIKAEVFDNFLTARFRLYTVAAKRIAYADIEHAPWPLQRAEVLHLEQDVIENSGVPRPQGDVTVHFSPSVFVRIGPLRLMRS
ncbi:MAG: DUF2071 domain-containing protein [Acidobacteriaceae bacterium]|nr:DUF2071 domain-containing protein [Acidobacteriaceae bacterium]